MANVDVQYLITHKPKKSDADPKTFTVQVGNAVDSKVFDHGADPKNKKGKKSMAAGSPDATATYAHALAADKHECKVTLGADITRVRVLLSPLGIGQKLRLELKAWGGSGFKSKTLVIPPAP